MISKLLNYHRKISEVTIRVALTETIQITFVTVIFTMVMLMISHLLIAGEFGTLWWSAERGWLWKNLIG